MLVVGLIGGIGSGKSTARDYLAKLGASVISADAINNELLQKDSPYFSQIVKHFGNQVVTDTDTLDKKLIRNIIFNDKEKKTWLEQLLHPAIASTIISEVHSCDTPYCLIEMLLLPDTSLIPVDRILAIDSATNIRIERTCSRDKCSVADVKKIINSQISQKEILDKAHDIIKNDDDLTSLHNQLIELHKKYISMGDNKL